MKYNHHGWLYKDKGEKRLSKSSLFHTQICYGNRMRTTKLFMQGAVLYSSANLCNTLSCQQLFCFSCLHLLLASVWGAYRNLRVHPPASCVLKFAIHCFSDILWHPDSPADGFTVLPEGTNSKRGGRFLRAPTSIPVLYTSYSNVLNWKDMEYFSGNKYITSWREVPMCRQWYRSSSNPLFLRYFTPFLISFVKHHWKIHFCSEDLHTVSDKSLQRTTSLSLHYTVLSTTAKFFNK